MSNDALALVAARLAEASPEGVPGRQVPALLRAVSALAGREPSSRLSREWRAQQRWSRDPMYHPPPGRTPAYLRPRQQQSFRRTQRQPSHPPRACLRHAPLPPPPQPPQPVPVALPSSPPPLVPAPPPSPPPVPVAPQAAVLPGQWRRVKLSCRQRQRQSRQQSSAPPQSPLRPPPLSPPPLVVPDPPRAAVAGGILVANPLSAPRGLPVGVVATSGPRCSSFPDPAPPLEPVGGTPPCRPSSSCRAGVMSSKAISDFLHTPHVVDSAIAGGEGDGEVLLEEHTDRANVSLSLSLSNVDVCGSYFKNPCYVGTCINDLKGSYSCICPPNHIERVTLYGFPTCDPANSSATDMTVTGDNWQCSDVSALVGLSLEGFYSNNAELDCNQPLPKGSVLQLGGTPEIPCTAFFYALKGDTCSYISTQLGLGGDDLAKLNPGLDCSPNGIKAGQSVCIERSNAFAYTVPECLRYDTLTTQDTCEVLLRRTSKESGGAVNGSNWAELYRTNPGLTCSSAIPSNIKVQVCLRAEYWSFTASVMCKMGKSKKVNIKDSCSRVFVTGRFTSDAQFAEYNGKSCSASGSVSLRSTRSSSAPSSSCEVEIYAGAMAAQELCWLTYLLTELGEAPRSPPVLYVDNKAMLALCLEHILEHRTNHIALCYFFARELQQRGQLRLAYVATHANTADIFTKALQPCDHQRFCTMLCLVPTWPHLLTS
ncbi:unnamed protein product [Closterium sp. NIES-54]